MPSPSRLISAALGLALAGLLGGCADYLKRQDTVTASAGDANAWNKVVQTTDPWPPHVMNTTITGDGQRVSRVIERYSAGPPPTSSSAGAASGADGAASSGFGAAPAQQ